MPAHTRLIEELKRQQAVLALTDAEFAAKLGIARTLWNQTRRGLLPVGLSLLRGTSKQFPGLKPLVLECVEASDQQTTHETVGSAA